MVVDRWGTFWFSLTLSLVVAVMMVTYVGRPRAAYRYPVKALDEGQIHSVSDWRSGRRSCMHAAVPLGRVAILMLGSHTLRYLAIVLLALAIVLQTGATSSVKAIKMSAKLAVGKHAEKKTQP